MFLCSTAACCIAGTWAFNKAGKLHLFYLHLMKYMAAGLVGSIAFVGYMEHVDTITGMTHSNALHETLFSTLNLNYIS